MFSLTLSVKDVLKEGFINNQENLSLDFTHVIAILCVTLVIGLFMFVIYRFTYEGVIYSHAYNMSILLISLITAMIIMTISSNIILSLGMVGALSIVRFRTAIKEPMDIVYMFWAVAVGITAGAGLFYLALGGSVFIGGTIIVFSLLKTSKKSYILVVYFENTCETEVMAVLNSIKNVIKSKTLTGDQVELTLKVKIKKNDTSFVTAINAIENVQSVSLVNFEENYL